MNIQVFPGDVSLPTGNILMNGGVVFIRATGVNKVAIGEDAEIGRAHV
jgi:hypothetical protein